MGATVPVVRLPEDNTFTGLRGRRSSPAAASGGPIITGSNVSGTTRNTTQSVSAMGSSVQPRSKFRTVQSRARFLSPRLVLIVAVAIGIHVAYRWAGQTAHIATPFVLPPANAPIRMLNARFTGSVDGRQIWSVAADKIDLDRFPGGGPTNIQSATLTGIHNGVLFASPAAMREAGPELGRSLASTRSVPGHSRRDLPAAAPAATFSAAQGRYLVAEVEPLPPDLAFLFMCVWQLKLTGGVDIHTAAGDRLRADSITILELRNRNNHRVERRLLCDSGVDVTLHGAAVHANQARYDPSERTVDCQGGVRGKFADGVVQADRLFWSLRDRVVRCPESCTGTLRGIPFTWTGLSVDLKRRRMSADTVRGLLRISSDVGLSLPATGTGK